MPTVALWTLMVAPAFSVDAQQLDQEATKTPKPREPSMAVEKRLSPRGPLRREVCSCCKDWTFPPRIV